jgi:hypothetical protein
MASVIPELPRDILDFEGKRSYLKFPVKGPPQIIECAHNGLSPWKFPVAMKTLACKIIRGPAGAYGMLYVKMAIKDSVDIDGPNNKPNMNFNGNIFGPAYVFCVFEAEFKLKHDMPDDAINLGELTKDLSDDAVNAGPYWSRRWSYRNNGGLKFPDDLINQAAERLSLLQLYNFNTLHCVMNEFIGNMMTDYAKKMAMHPPSTAGIAQWVYDNVSHPHVERMIVRVRMATGISMTERKECIPRSTEAAIAIIKAVKNKLEQIALEEHGIRMVIKFDLKLLSKLLRKSSAPWNDPNFTNSDSVARYAKIFRKLAFESPDVLSPDVAGSVTQGSGIQVQSMQSTRAPGLLPPTREPTMEELRTIHDAREAADAARRLAEEATKHRKTVAARVARREQPDKPLTPKGEQRLPQKSNKKRGKSRGKGNEAQHLVHTSEPARARRHERGEEMKELAQAQAFEHRAIEKANALIKMGKEVEKNHEALSHHVPPPSSIGAVLGAALAKA